MQHITELRKRLFWTALVGLGIGGVAYSYYDPIMKVIMAPLGDEKLVYLTPGGGFAFIFSAMLYVTAIGVLPFFLYQVYAFLKPATPDKATKLSVKVALASTLLMVAGVAFGYFVAIPQGLVFLTTFASDYVVPSLTAESYLNFVFSYALGIGALFQLPLLLMIWHWMSPLTPRKLLSSERYVIVAAFILAAVISPTPDAINQAMIAVPIIVVYQFGVVAILLSIRKKTRLARKEAKLTAKQVKRATKADKKKKPLPVSTASPADEPLPPSIIAALQAAPAAPQPATPVVKAPQPVRRRSAPTIDGFGFRPRGAAMPTKPQSAPLAARPVRVHNSMTDVVHKTTPVAPPRQNINRGSITIPPRKTGLISDFGPIHRSAIDMSR